MPPCRMSPGLGSVARCSLWQISSNSVSVGSGQVTDNVSDEISAGQAQKSQQVPALKKLSAIAVAEFNMVFLSGEKPSNISPVTDNNKHRHEAGEDQQRPLAGQRPGWDYPARLSKYPEPPQIANQESQAGN